MTSRERVLTTLQCREPDQVPFMDYFNTEVVERILGVKAGTPINPARFAEHIGMDGIYFTDYVGPVY